jgi:hypothetical protein
MKDSHDVVHKELEQEQMALGEMRKMLKALANTLKALCAEGKLPEHSRNLLVNPQFATPGGAGCVAPSLTHPYPSQWSGEGSCLTTSGCHGWGTPGCAREGEPGVQVNSRTHVPQKLPLFLYSNRPTISPPNRLFFYSSAL